MFLGYWDVASLRPATLHRKTRTTAKSAQSVSVFAPPISLAPLFCVSLFLTFLIEGQKRGPKTKIVKTKRKQGPKKGQNFIRGKTALVQTHPRMCFFRGAKRCFLRDSKNVLDFFGGQKRQRWVGWVQRSATPKRSNTNIIQATEKNKAAKQK